MIEHMKTLIYSKVDSNLLQLRTLSGSTTYMHNVCTYTIDHIHLASSSVIRQKVLYLLFFILGI